jgi:hypothetical protein
LVFLLKTFFRGLTGNLISKPIACRVVIGEEEKIDNKPISCDTFIRKFVKNIVNQYNAHYLR